MEQQQNTEAPQGAVPLDCKVMRLPGEWKAPTVEDAHKMGAKGGPVVEAERLAFEAWMTGHCWTIGAIWDGETYRGSAEHGNYLCPHAMNVRTLWAAWRDRAALANAGRWIRPADA